MDQTDIEFTLDDRSAVGLVLRWMLTFAPAIVLGIAIPVVESQRELYRGYGDPTTIQTLLVLAAFFICALTIGMLQDNVLSRYLVIGRSWVIATVSGISLLILFFLGIFVFAKITHGGEIPYSVAAPGWAIVWLVSASAQYLVLRRYLRPAVLHLIALVIAGEMGYGLATVLALSSDATYFDTTISLNDSYLEPLGWIASITATALLAGLGTGVVLVWLLRHARQYRVEEPASLNEPVTLVAED